jgi:hypothetical protein
MCVYSHRIRFDLLFQNVRGRLNGSRGPSDFNVAGTSIIFASNSRPSS